MLLLWIRLLSRLGCKTDSGSFRANSLETSELLPAEVIALWKIHPQPWKRYPTPTQAGLWSSLLNFNDWYPMCVSCLLGHSLERRHKNLIMVSLRRTDVHTLSCKREEKATPLTDRQTDTLYFFLSWQKYCNVNYWRLRVKDTCGFCWKLLRCEEKLIRTYKHLISWDDIIFLIVQLLWDSSNKGACSRRL